KFHDVIKFLLRRDRRDGAPEFMSENCNKFVDVHGFRVVAAAFDLRHFHVKLGGKPEVDDVARGKVCGDIRGGNERKRVGDEKVVEVEVLRPNACMGFRVPQDMFRQDSSEQTDTCTCFAVVIQVDDGNFSVLGYEVNNHGSGTHQVYTDIFVFSILLQTLDSDTRCHWSCMPPSTLSEMLLRLRRVLTGGSGTAATMQSTGCVRRVGAGASMVQLTLHVWQRVQSRAMRCSQSVVAREQRVNHRVCICCLRLSRNLMWDEWLAEVGSVQAKCIRGETRGAVHATAEAPGQCSRAMLPPSECGNNEGGNRRVRLRVWVGERETSRGEPLAQVAASSGKRESGRARAGSIQAGGRRLWWAAQCTAGGGLQLLRDVGMDGVHSRRRWWWVQCEAQVHATGGAMRVACGAPGSAQVLRDADTGSGLEAARFCCHQENTETASLREGSGGLDYRFRWQIASTSTRASVALIQAIQAIFYTSNRAFKHIRYYIVRPKLKWNVLYTFSNLVLELFLKNEHEKHITYAKH
ncbi:hypothetical protein GGX14DRAFT_408708, partial [Mycena pura]